MSLIPIFAGALAAAYKSTLSSNEESSENGQQENSAKTLKETSEKEDHKNSNELPRTL